MGIARLGHNLVTKPPSPICEVSAKESQTHRNREWQWLPVAEDGEHGNTLVKG